MPQSRDINLLLITSAILLGVVGLNLAGYSPFAGNKYVTVTGTAIESQQNQISTFSATVTSVNSVKSIAVSEMNSKSDALLAAIKEFGIPEKDIETTYVNVYQEQRWIQDEGRSIPGDWRASTTVEIVLRDLSQSSDLYEMLSLQDTESLYGPNSRIDSEGTDETGLMALALNNARVKAASIARAGGMRLGPMVRLVEGTSYSDDVYGFPRMGAGGGDGMEIAPGSTDVSKTVTVTFRLR